MSRGTKLIKNTATYFIGSFGSKILSFLLLPIYSYYLTTEAYGSYDLINTVVQIAYPAITLMLDNALYVYLISADNLKRKKDIISFSVRTLIGNCCITVVICLVLNRIFRIRYMGWAVLWLVSYSIFNTWSQMCRGFSRQKLFSLAGVIVTAVTLAGNIVGLVILRQDYSFLMISNCAAYMTATFFLESRLNTIHFVKEGRASLGLKMELLKYTVPLLPNQLSWWILNVSDRLMITYYLGAGANGIYAMACKIPAVLTVIHSIFSAAWSDDILSSGDIKETEGYAVKIYNKYIRLIIGVAIVLIAANKFIFQYIISGNFVEAYKYTYFLYIGFLFSSLGSLLGAFYGYFKKSLNVSLSTIAAGTVNFLINLLFLNDYGIQIASISTFAGAIVIWLIRLIGLRGLVEIHITRRNKLMFLLFIPFYFTDRIEGKWQNLILLLIGCSVALLVNLQTVKEAKDKIFLKMSNKKGQ